MCGRPCQLSVNRFAQATSLATLIVTGALICAGDPEQPHKIAAYSAVPLVVIPLVNAFSGIRVCLHFLIPLLIYTRLQSPFSICHLKSDIVTNEVC